MVVEEQQKEMLPSVEWSYLDLKPTPACLVMPGITEPKSFIAIHTCPYEQEKSV